jgi:hypothetical protein
MRMSVIETRPHDRYQALREYIDLQTGGALDVDAIVRMCEEKLVELARGAVKGWLGPAALSKFDGALENRLYRGTPSVVQAVFESLDETKLISEQVRAIARAFDEEVENLRLGQ